MQRLIIWSMCFCRNILFMQFLWQLLWLLFNVPYMLYLKIEGLYFNFSILYSTEFWSLSSCRLTVWLYKSSKHVQFQIRCFFNWDSLVLEWDLWFFTKSVPGLTITIWNKITVTGLSCSIFSWCTTGPWSGLEFNKQERITPFSLFTIMMYISWDTHVPRKIENKMFTCYSATQWTAQLHNNFKPWYLQFLGLYILQYKELLGGKKELAHSTWGDTHLSKGI